MIRVHGHALAFRLASGHRRAHTGVTEIAGITGHGFGLLVQHAQRRGLQRVGGEGAGIGAPGAEIVADLGLDGALYGLQSTRHTIQWFVAQPHARPSSHPSAYSRAHGISQAISVQRTRIHRNGPSTSAVEMYTKPPMHAAAHSAAASAQSRCQPFSLKADVFPVKPQHDGAQPPASRPASSSSRDTGRRSVDAHPAFRTLHRSPQCRLTSSSSDRFG